MFQRNLLKELRIWRNSPHRKPLILRGARQIGKTTLVKLFSQDFDQTVTLNLEHASERKHWEGEPSVEVLLRSIEVTKGIRITNKTLLFLDEIQNEPRAIQSLRYLYEQRPDLPVIATGSLLEVALKNKGFSFPVGRVSFLYLSPLTFDEFLVAVGRAGLVEELGEFQKNPQDTNIPPAVHSLATELFAEYLFLGGMPEVVRLYLEEKSYLPLASLKEGLLTSFEEDVPKYATPAQVPYIHFLIRQAPLFAGQRIQYTNFANSNYRSREMRRAFETLEKAMITQRVLATTQAIPPLQAHLRASPKLLFLDVGLVAHRLGLEPSALKARDLNDLFRGTIAEQLVGQELMAANPHRREAPFFWFRHEPG
ncbi:MAG: ATP-binding protein, partial [Deltaproteobacteria bacterium]|nr:ATP-binding protein [Deltaproteobacteria bacterium]